MLGGKSVDSKLLNCTFQRLVLASTESETVRFRGIVWSFVTWLVFYGEELLAPRPTPNLEDHPLSAVSDCLFDIFAATLHIWRPFLQPQPEDAGGELLWIRWWTFGFHKMRGISWVAQDVLAFQEGLCSTEWVSKNRKHTVLLTEYHGGCHGLSMSSKCLPAINGEIWCNESTCKT
jgi:hypothetical protein